jgi:hypothetical protein
MSSARKPAHIAIDLGEDGLCCQHADAGDGRQEPDQGAKGGQISPALLVDGNNGRKGFQIDLFDRCRQRVDLSEVKPQQKAMVISSLSHYPSFPRKRESRGPISERLPPVHARGRLWTPAFAGVTRDV